MKHPTVWKRRLRIFAVASFGLSFPLYAGHANDEPADCGYFDAEYASTNLADESPPYRLKLRLEEEFPFDPGELGFLPEDVFTDAYVHSIIISAVDEGSSSALSELYLPVLCTSDELMECSALLLLPDDAPETDELAPFLIKTIELDSNFAAFRRGPSDAPFLVVFTNLYPELQRTRWIDHAVGLIFHSTPNVTPDFTDHSVWKFERCTQ